MKESIDRQLLPLIIELNRAGYPTHGSCQGRQTDEDFFLGRHSRHAYISFATSVPRQISKRASALGLLVSNAGFTIAPDYPDRSEETYMTHNKIFAVRVQELFFGTSPCNS